MYLEALGAVAVVDLVAEAARVVRVIAANPRGGAQKVLERGAHCGRADPRLNGRILIWNTLHTKLQKLNLECRVA